MINNFIFGLYIIIFFSMNNANAQWIQINEPSGSDIRVLAASDTNLFAGTYSSGVYISTNYGGSWTAVDTTSMKWTIDALAVSDTNIFLASNGYGNGVFLSTNKGGSWTAVNNGLTYTDVRALAISDTNIFAGTYSGGVFLSTNKGSNWTSLIAELPINYICALAVNGRTVFAGCSYIGIILSSDNGSSWTTLDTTLNSVSVRALAVKNTYVFAGTYSGGVYFSTNNCSSWTSINTGLPDNYVCALTVCGAYLFASTPIGLWRRPFSEIVTGIENQTIQISSHFNLEQNYPNPFNPSTTIRYQIPNAGHVTLKVFDILGREVATLVDEVKEVGAYTAVFNASKLASGVYFARFIAQSQDGNQPFTRVTKLLLTK